MSDVKVAAPPSSGVSSPAPANGATSASPATAPKPKPAATPLKKSASGTTPTSSTTIAKPISKAIPQSGTLGSKPTKTAASNGVLPKSMLNPTTKAPGPKVAASAPVIKSTGTPVTKPAVKAVESPGAKPGTTGTQAAIDPATGSTAPKALPRKVQPGTPKAPVAGLAPKGAPQLSAKAASPVQARGATPVAAKSKGITSQAPNAKGPAQTKAPAPGFVDKTDKFLADGTKIVTGVSTFLGALDKMFGDDKPAPTSAKPVAKAKDAKAPLPKGAPASAPKGVPTVPATAKGPATSQILPNMAQKGPVEGNTLIDVHATATEHNVLQPGQVPRGLDYASTSEAYVPVPHPYNQSRGIAVDNVPVSANVLNVGQEVTILQTAELLIEDEYIAQPEYVADEEVAFVQYTETKYLVEEHGDMEEGGEEYVYEEDSGVIQGEEFVTYDHIDEGAEIGVADTTEETVYQEEIVEELGVQQYDIEETQDGEGEEETTNFESEEPWQTAGDEEDAGLEEALIDLGIVEHDYNSAENEEANDADEEQNFDAGDLAEETLEVEAHGNEGEHFDQGDHLEPTVDDDGDEIQHETFDAPLQDDEEAPAQEVTEDDEEDDDMHTQQADDDADDDGEAGNGDNGGYETPPADGDDDDDEDED